jgi:outer membrane lipoprotein-sorting protein
MNRNIKLAVFLCVLAGILSACETLPPPKPVQSPEQLLTLAEITRTLSARQEGIQNVKSRVKTAVKTRQNNHTLKQVLLIDGDTSLRLDTLSMFGQPVAVLIADQNQILLYDVKSNTQYKDAQVWDIMARMFGTVYDFREYISVLSGKIPRLDSLQLKDVQWSPETGNYHVSGTDPERHEQVEIEVDAETLLPIRLVTRQDGASLYAVKWENYQEVDQQMFPGVVTIQRPEREDEVIMTYNNPLINQGVPDDAFQLNLPENP